MNILNPVLKNKIVTQLWFFFHHSKRQIWVPCDKFLGSCHANNSATNYNNIIVSLGLCPVKQKKKRKGFLSLLDCILKLKVFHCHVSLNLVLLHTNHCRTVLSVLIYIIYMVNCFHNNNINFWKNVCG